MSTQNLLSRARADQAITGLPDNAKRGAEAYLQAYDYVANGNPGETRPALRELAAQYLDFTASPPLNAAQQTAATTARETLMRLS
jgi:hypothetical protein